MRINKKHIDKVPGDLRHDYNDDEDYISIRFDKWNYIIVPLAFLVAFAMLMTLLIHIVRHNNAENAAYAKTVCAKVAGKNEYYIAKDNTGCYIAPDWHRVSL